MGLPQARLTDLFAGICCCHCIICCIGMSGVVITASPNTNVNNLGTARLTDIVLGFCGHTGVIVSGSPNVQTNNLHNAHLTSSVVGCLIGTIITGSSDTFVS